MKIGAADFLTKKINLELDQTQQMVLATGSSLLAAGRGLLAATGSFLAAGKSLLVAGRGLQAACSRSGETYSKLEANLQPRSASRRPALRECVCGLATRRSSV